jgi:CBS domain-containing protein
MARLAKDVMSPHPVCVPRDMDLRDLAKLFLEKGFTGAPVVDARGDLVGVISQTDLLYYHLTRDDELVLSTDFYASAKIEGRTMPRGFQVEDVNTGRVEDVMTPVVHAVEESAPVASVARMMTTKHIHRVIVRRGRRAVGIISALDVLRALGGDGPRAVAARPKVKKAARKPAKKRAAKGVKKGTKRAVRRPAATRKKARKIA